MPTLQNELKELLEVIPQWSRFLSEPGADGGTISGGSQSLSHGQRSQALLAFFERINPKEIYKLLLSLGGRREVLLKPVRDHYFIGLATKILGKNPSLRRFFQERRMDRQSQSGHIASLAAELALKLDDSLRKKIGQGDEDGFRVLLPAYVQTAANNAVIDYIKLECNWEKQTDLVTDEDDEDPRDRVAGDLAQIPENKALSKEKVKYLNELRSKLEVLFKKTSPNEPALLAVDCIFGLGLSPHSKAGFEMTMRECCDRLNLEGETQARKIARCQVLLDKGLDQVRELLREEMPDLVEYRKQEINVNTASKRDLRHQLSFTETEVDKLVPGRQFSFLEQLIEKAIVNAQRLDDLTSRGAVAVLVPVDVNSATARDLTDILGLSKEVAKKVTESRPFGGTDDLINKQLLSKNDLAKYLKNGLVVKAVNQRELPNLNTANRGQLIKAGLPESLADSILPGRPYVSWFDLDQFVGSNEAMLASLRKNFSLSGSSS
jgi:DNA uptake protein ComE-like DNA-binding protein